MTSRKLRYTLSAAAWVATFFCALALISSANAVCLAVKHAISAPFANTATVASTQEEPTL